MAVSDQKVDGVDESQSGGSEEQKSTTYNKDFVNKILGEKKKTASENEELRKKVSEFENQKLQTEGKQTELIDSLKKQLFEKEQKLHKATLQYAQNAMFSAIKTEAVKQGCVDPEALIKLADLNSLDVDAETFTVSQEGLTTLVSQMAAEKSYLFKKQVAGVKDANPGTSTDKPVKMNAANLSKMNGNDLKKILAMKLGSS